MIFNIFKYKRFTDLTILNDLPKSITYLISTLLSGKLTRE